MTTKHPAKSPNYKKSIGDIHQQLDTLAEKLHLLEQDLLESEERFRLIAEFSCDWEYWQEVDGTFVYTSPSCEAITAYTPAEFAENKELIQKVIHPDDWQKWLAHSHEMTKNGKVEPIEFRIVTKSGQIRWIHHVCRKILAETGEIRGVRGSNRDITKQKAMQEEIKILQGFLPICASCKMIRDDKGYWNQIETYISQHSEAVFSHGICPACAKKLYPELNLYGKDQKKKKG